MSTKETLRHLLHLFSPSTTPTPFPLLTLSSETLALLDTNLSQFSASFPQGIYGGHHRDSESERERTKWREGLLEIWATIEPLPGTEVEQNVVARVSAFIVLLERLSSFAGEDDEMALVSRKDIALVWWSELLRRTILGTTTLSESTGVGAKRRVPPATTSAVRKGKEAGGVRVLVVSSAAMTSARNMVQWAMAIPINGISEGAEERMTAFGHAVFDEYEKRAVAMMKGGDEGFGVRNLEECIIGWGEKFTKAFFLHMSPFLLPTSTSLVPILSLLVSFLCRHSAKSYHALRTPLFPALNLVGILSPSSPAVTLVIKCLSIFLVTLPVIFGEPLAGSMAVYGRVVTWDWNGEGAEVSAKMDVGFEDLPLEDNTFGPPPDPFALFTVLYGIYPCNFTTFLKDAVTYLKAKNWSGPLGDGVIGLDSIAVRERSRPLIRLHTLHPSLITSDLATELTDTNRWRRLESADVMADCDRNVIQIVESPDLRRAPAPFSLSSPDFSPRRARSTTTRFLNSSAPDRFGYDDGSNGSTPTGELSRSRSTTPHLPATTHYANFQALQSLSTNFGGNGNGTPRSMSTFSSATSPTSPLSLSSSLLFDEYNPNPISAIPSRHPLHSNNHSTDSSALPSTTTSRRSSFGGGPPPTVTLNPTHLTSELPASPRPPSSIRTTTSTTTTTLPAGGKLEIPAHILRLESDLILLKAEVDFQIYLKGLHLAHMGTLHREKVLESGAEAERQSLFRTIRTTRTQLQQTQSSLERLRTESGVTKGNWIAHIEELKEKLKSMREGRTKMDQEMLGLRAECGELKDLLGKRSKELEEQGALFFDLQNQVTLDAAKLERITEYEARIVALSTTLAICDEDLCKFREQRGDMEKLVGVWKTSQLLIQSLEAELVEVKKQLRSRDETAPALAHITNGKTTLTSVESGRKSSETKKSDEDKMRVELMRLRERNLELEEEVRELREKDD